MQHVRPKIKPSRNASIPGLKCPCYHTFFIEFIMQRGSLEWKAKGNRSLSLSLPSSLHVGSLINWAVPLWVCVCVTRRLRGKLIIEGRVVCTAWLITVRRIGKMCVCVCVWDCQSAPVQITGLTLPWQLEYNRDGERETREKWGRQGGHKWHW